MSLTYLILNYNNSTFLSECVDNINRIKREDDRVIILDDKSTDNSWEIISAYDKNSDLTVLQNESNLGMYNSISRIISAIETDFLTIVDSDDIINVSLSDFLQNDKFVRYMFKLIHGPSLLDNSKLYPGRSFNLDPNLNALGALLKHGNYVGSTTSSNVYHVRTLIKITKDFNFTNNKNYFDIPSFDGFIHRKIAFEGKVYSSNMIVGLYRMHQKNNGARHSIFSYRKILRSVKVIESDCDYLENTYAINGTNFKKVLIRDKKILLLIMLHDLYKYNVMSYLRNIVFYFLWFFSLKNMVYLIRAHFKFFKSCLDD